MTVAVDRRVLILQELESLLKGLTINLTTGVIPAGNFLRNRNALPKELVPGFLLLDGDERPDPRTPAMMQGRQTGISPVLMRMTPEIYVVLDVRKPQNINVGEDLSIARSVLLKAVLGDKTLQTIVGSNGSISYGGCITDLARNRTMQGQMGVIFTFVYPWLPGEVIEF